jgi:DNA ligase-4
VQLKKDYIPGLGDTLDMCVVGAAWEKEKARDLGGTHFTHAIFGRDTHNYAVGTDTLTTFYVAALSERPAAVRRT